MKQREVEKRLKQYAAACEGIVPENKEAGIRKLLQAEPELCTRGTLFDFVLEQIGYLGRYCLIWQGLWVVFFCYLMQYGMPRFIGWKNEKEVLVMISFLPPILVLLTVEEITKVYQRSMLEIEYAARYSLRSVVMVRMLALSMFHAIVLAVCIICLHTRLDSEVGQLLVYGFTPMMIVTGCLLKLMQYCQGEMLRSISVGLYILTVILAVIGNTAYCGWYQPVYFKIWCMACVAGGVFMIWQFVCLYDRLASFEQITQY